MYPPMNGFVRETWFESAIARVFSATDNIHKNTLSILTCKGFGSYHFLIMISVNPLLNAPSEHGEDDKIDLNFYQPSRSYAGDQTGWPLSTPQGPEIQRQMLQWRRHP
jgi:hypothetical protein